MSNKYISIAVLLIGFFPNNVFPYDETITHPGITEIASNNSNLGNYLSNNLGFSAKLKTRFPSNSEKSILYWLRKGSIDEDSPPCRATNHFHNPLKPWDQSYLSDVPLWLNAKCSSSRPWYSNITWGTGYISPDGGKVDRVNQYMGWDYARDYYYWALTGISNTERETYFAKTFQALGQVLHLLQDISVPAHVRNDFKSHYLGLVPSATPGGPPITGVKMNRLESYVKENPSLISAANPAPPFFSSPRLTDFWDTDQYIGDNPSNSLSLGLAEFANANYFSDWTIPNNKPEPQHLFPYPVVNSGNALICEDYAPGSKDLRKYISRRKESGQCPPITEARMADHFATPSLLNEEPLITNENISSLMLWLDENVHDTYAKELLPRAIGYSAGLINYFFRGNLQVMAVPIFYKGNLSFMKLKVKNMTPDEAMKNGHFALTYRYTPAGASADGSEDIFGRAWGLDGSAVVPCIELKGASKKADGTMEWGEMEVDFMIYPALPKKDYDSIRFMLAFRGTLGNEVGAVGGKAFSPGEVVFNEEWDNGLTGNHAWGHTGFNLDNGNPDNGSTGNVIVGDTLIKDNIRFQEEGEARVNESTVSVLFCNGQFKDILPILVTPNTYLMYKIDAMSINQIPPAPPGETNQWQGLWLYFNQGRVLQISQEEQMVYWNPTTAYYTFPLGVVILDNIHKLFQGWGIAIPEGSFYLQGIDFVQQLSLLGGLPSSVEHHQHMEVDFIQIIEGKEQ